MHPTDTRTCTSTHKNTHIKNINLTQAAEKKTVECRRGAGINAGPKAARASLAGLPAHKAVDKKAAVKKRQTFHDKWAEDVSTLLMLCKRACACCVCVLLVRTVVHHGCMKNEFFVRVKTEQDTFADVNDADKISMEDKLRELRIEHGCSMGEARRRVWEKTWYRHPQKAKSILNPLLNPL